MTKGLVKGVNANLVTIEVDGAVGQNEICFLLHNGVRLRAEVIRVNGNRVAAQVFETTTGIKTDTPVEFTGHMLEVELGPGILSKNYDGLQSDLEKMGGVFITTGEITNPLDDNVFYAFKPLLAPGATVQAGNWVGTVRENWIDHKIMVPFAFEGRFELKWIAEAGDYKIYDHIATLETPDGQEVELNMTQKWPVKKVITAYREKLRPFDILKTGLRVIDTFNPITEGGTGYIPGPFGTGKTVLQQAIAKNAEADIIIIVACGERANEVVDIFTEFPELTDPRTGRKLQERTTIICNTSNMPVAAREASVYVGMTLAEYYRNMGLKVLMLADSTSRWAQALREMSNRLEELPGQDAFPVELPATIANFYSRAGYVDLLDDGYGSITFIGTVSPAGGNFKEPVTEATSKVAHCFYALSQKRADAKRYPAIDPVDSYSKFLDYEEFRQYTDEHIQPGWVDLIKTMKDLMRKGIEAKDQINILGEDAVPLNYHIDFWRSELIDFSIIQQDSFDDVDTNTPLDRQKYMINKVMEICGREFTFEGFEQISATFKQLINIMRQMNYSEFNSRDFVHYESQLDAQVNELSNNEKEVEL